MAFPSSGSSSESPSRSIPRHPASPPKVPSHSNRNLQFQDQRSTINDARFLCDLVGLPIAGAFGCQCCLFAHYTASVNCATKGFTLFVLWNACKITGCLAFIYILKIQQKATLGVILGYLCTFVPFFSSASSGELERFPDASTRHLRDDILSKFSRQ
jgi:hypothetical protein